MIWFWSVFLCEGRKIDHIIIPSCRTSKYKLTLPF